MKEMIIAVVGPTAVGKSALSVEIAKAFDGEVISGDSMQVYKGMDIGTAKMAEDEMQGIPHHMIDIKKPSDTFSVADFKHTVEEKINAITERGRIPIIAGGSGLYIQAVLYDYTFSGHPKDPCVALQLKARLQEKGGRRLYEELKAIDPIQAAKIHPNNHRRIIRAMEVYESTGETVTEREKQTNTEPVYNAFLIGLSMDRELLYEQIDNRVDQMIESGLIEEAKMFYDLGFGNTQAMKAIGYKEFIPYFQEKQSLEEVIQSLKQHSRRYAKRQYTWFRNKLPVDWYTISPSAPAKTFQQILHDLAGKL